MYSLTDELRMIKLHIIISCYQKANSLNTSLTVRRERWFAIYDIF